MYQAPVVMHAFGGKTKGATLSASAGARGWDFSNVIALSFEWLGSSECKAN
jgi:hypothetical protein